MIHIAIADDHSLFRRGLISLLSEIENFKVSLEAENGKELLDQLNTIPIDVILLDLEMPVIDGYEVIESINVKYPNIKIIAISFKENLKKIDVYNHLKVDGYYDKAKNPFEIIEIIHSFKQPIRKYKYSVDKTHDEIVDQIRIEFSEREKEILRLHALEYNGKEVAELLNLSPRTIEVHKKNIMKRVGSKNFIGAILYAFQNNLI